MQESRNNTLNEESFDLIRIVFNPNNLSLSIESSLVLVLIIIVLLAAGFWFFSRRIKRYKLVKVNIPLGNIGEAEFAPNEKDIQIAHEIWVELVTRKAAQPIDEENDVLVEIYDSWYELFKRVRTLIAEIPPDLLRHESSTQKVVDIATKTLNTGLRPHLTMWQARFRNWYAANDGKLKEISPQELQKQYPEYKKLVADMRAINQNLISYAQELKKIVDGNGT
jgi:hypothetical protein